jgi:MEMO1 family protein
MRKAVVAGQFYPAIKEKLEKEVKKYLKPAPEFGIKAAVVPHAGYMFSGRCAGKVFSLLPSAETYIIIGVNHRGLGEDIALSLENFQTPFGEIGNDVVLGEEILRQLGIPEDEEAHLCEHSIEVQLPFLQATQENFHIIPILLKNYNIETCKKLAGVIVSAANGIRRRVVLIASSDFTHTGPAYGFDGPIELDKPAIDKILAGDTQGFLELAEKITICGAGAIATIMEVAKLLGATHSKLLEYYDSSSVLKNENKVGYAGIVFSDVPPSILHVQDIIVDPSADASPDVNVKETLEAEKIISGF